MLLCTTKGGSSDSQQELVHQVVGRVLARQEMPALLHSPVGFMSSIGVLPHSLPADRTQSRYAPMNKRSVFRLAAALGMGKYDLGNAYCTIKQIIRELHPPVAFPFPLPAVVSHKAGVTLTFTCLCGAPSYGPLIY
jgi:hypothetical protein